DGIRGRNVTGVQTCALPIWLLSLAGTWDGTFAAFRTVETVLRALTCRGAPGRSGLNRRRTRRRAPVGAGWAAACLAGSTAARSGTGVVGLSTHSVYCACPYPLCDIHGTFRRFRAKTG